MPPQDTTGRPAQKTEGHHSDRGENVIGGLSLSGRDVFRAAVLMSRMPMCLSDPHQPDQPLVFVNRAFCEMTGYEEHEVLGRNCRFLQGPGTDPADVARVRAAVDAAADISIEIFNYKKDGTGFWNALYLSPVLDDSGKLIFLFASQLDVTRRREAQAMRQKSHRMDTLGSMAGGVAHEFNNLLTVVLANLEPLERTADERGLRRLTRANEAIRRAARLTQQLLSFARRQYLDAQAVDLRVPLLDMDALIGQLAGPAVTVRFDLPQEPVCTELDVGQLEVALMNLVRNAREAMPEGGELMIGLHRVDPDWAELAVRDTGWGMTPDVAGRAVDPFFTTKDQGTGAGLGLSMVHGFAAQSGGALQIVSQPSQGTTVILRFPLIADQADPSHPGPSHPGPSHPGSSHH